MYCFYYFPAIFCLLIDTNSKISTNDYIIKHFEYSSIAVGLTEKKDGANQINSHNVVK